MDVREKEERRRKRRRRSHEVLHQKLRSLEQDWDSFKQTHPCAILRRWSVDHSNTNTTTSCTTVNSSRSLMLSLQQYYRSSPNSEAMEEVLPRGPKAAIERGKYGALMELDSGTEMGLGEREERSSSSVSCNYNGNSHDGDENCADKEEEVVLGNCGFEYCSNSSALSLSDDKKMKREELVLMEREGIGGVGCRISSRSGWRLWMLLMGWFSVFLLMVLILGFISLRCTRAGFGVEDEVRLLPT